MFLFLLHLIKGNGKIITMQKEYIRQLITSYINGELPASGREELIKLSQPGHDELVVEVMNEMMMEDAADAPAVNADELRSSLSKVLSVDKPASQPARVRSLFWRRMAIAASVVIAVGAGSYFWFAGRQKPTQPLVINDQPRTNDAAPGKQGATLTLANGQKILLDSLGNGVITEQGTTTVLIRNGQLVYDAKATDGEVLYNTMTTPKGRQYQLVLPDGTGVWLNAASSITYPAAFTGDERKVAITGEAYFEVAKDKARPFTVSVNNQSEVEVLGTHFNINAYNDEGMISTTLLEGSVKVTHGSEQVTIKPGQQAQSGKAIRIVNDADIQQVMAWKNGYFNFNNTDIRLILKQLERWYDVDVVFEGELKPKPIYGKMQKDLYLSQVLEILKKLGVKYRIEGRQLIIVS